MKHFATLLALSLSLALPTLAQDAPTGWTTQIKAGGARTFTPPDLAAGETYSVTIYNAKPLGGKSLEAFLRTFAGTVGTQPGQLSAALTIEKQSAQAVTGLGTYIGPNGARITAAFNAFSFDGEKTVWVSRVLTSSNAVFFRYQSSFETLANAMAERAKIAANPSQSPARAGVRTDLPDGMTVGGDLVPGVYEGRQTRILYSRDTYNDDLRVTIFPNGEYRISDLGGKQLDRNGDDGTGKVKYERATGRLTISENFCLRNDPAQPESDYCVFGRNRAGQVVIFSRTATHEARVNRRPTWDFIQETALFWKGPPKGALPSLVEGRIRLAKAKKEADAIEAARFKSVTAPGRGVQSAQIRTILVDTQNHVNFSTYTLFLLLRDGTVRKDLPVAPDELDVAKSRRNEPKTWGKWRKTKDGYQVSWAGGAWQDLPGFAVVPASANQKLNGYYGRTTSSHAGIFSSSSSSGTRYGKDGRFEDESSSLSVTSGSVFGSGSVVREDDNGSSVMGAGPGYSIGGDTTKNNPLADRQGTYSLNGYVLTLRYDNGQIVRRPFFFWDKTHDSLWNGSQLAYYDEFK